jgi:hypothetical protein
MGPTSENRPSLPFVGAPNLVQNHVGVLFASAIRARSRASGGKTTSAAHVSALTTALLGARWSADGFAKELSGGSAGIEIPDAMRGFLDQVGQLGSLPGMGGLGASLPEALPPVCLQGHVSKSTFIATQQEPEL